MSSSPDNNSFQESPKSWSCVLDVTGNFEPSSSVLGLKKIKEDLSKFKLADSSVKRLPSALKPKLTGYAPVREKFNKKKKYHWH